jgi:uncharacterized protein (TIGR03083 family)
MNRTEVWPQIDPYRRRLIEALTELSDADWQQPSLCTGWTVKEAMAHLTYQHISIGTGLAGTVRARGNTDRMIHDVAVRRAAKLSTVELVELLRGLVGSRRHPPGVSWREAVTDNFVHAQDMLIPLGRQLDMPVGPAAVAAERCYTMPTWRALPAMPKAWPFQPKRGLRRFRLRATDTGWSIGDEPEIAAPIGDLLLLITGRLVVLPRLSGTAADELRQALTPVNQQRV